MKINDDHMYHGAALNQIAEHPQFTAINVFKDRREISRSAFRINDDIAVFLKYAKKSKLPYDDYQFTFSTKHLQELHQINNKVRNRTYVALVCVKDRQICCLPYAKFEALIKKRLKAKKADEDQYTILVTLPQNKSFRVDVNVPGKRNLTLGKSILISRKDFPAVLFA